VKIVARAGGFAEFGRSAKEGDERLASRLQEGTVDYATWLAASVDPRLLGQPVCVKAAMRALDPDQDGRVSSDDVCRAARALAPALAPAGAKDGRVDHEDGKESSGFDAEAIAAVLMSTTAGPTGAATDSAVDVGMQSKAVINGLDAGSGLEFAPRCQAPPLEGSNLFATQAVESRPCSSVSSASTSFASSAGLWAFSASTTGSSRASRVKARFHASV